MSGLIHSVTLVSADVVSTPVMNVKAIPVTGGTVGYMLFNNHLATSEAALVSAFTTLKTDGVTDLVLDIRYNGGGYLDIASEVAYMIAGPGPTTGQTFELTQFNSKQQAFLDFVLSQYVKVGVHELDKEKLSPLLNLKYDSISDAIADLGRPEEIGKVFSGFQKYLYEAVA